MTGGLGFTPSFRITAEFACDVIFVPVIKGTSASLRGTEISGSGSFEKS
jgi:hypothetical protein